MDRAKKATKYICRVETSVCVHLRACGKTYHSSWDCLVSTMMQRSTSLMAVWNPSSSKSTQERVKTGGGERRNTCPCFHAAAAAAILANGPLALALANGPFLAFCSTAGRLIRDIINRISLLVYVVASKLQGSAKTGLDPIPQIKYFEIHLFPKSWLSC